MGCCQKKKKEINKKLADDLYNESLVPDLSPSDAQTTRISKEPEIKESFTPSLENKGSSLEGQGASLDDFKPLKILGQGSFGKVILVKNETNDNVYAMKILEKKHLIKKNQISHTKTERIALEKLKHPFIIKLHYAFQDLKNLYLITEFLPGGELFFHLRKSAGFKEKVVKFYMAQVLLALEFMHKNNYIYRDLKPENILIDKEGNIKLTDFGLSKIMKPKEVTFTLCGTAEYLAPEILFGQGYDKTCDWFSFGVVMFEMFCGYHPFNSKKKKIDPTIYLRKTYIPDKVGKDAKDLIEKLFVVNPQKRLGYNSADEVKQHPFFKDIDFDKVINKEYTPPFIPELDNDTDLRYFDQNIRLNKTEEDKSEVNDGENKDKKSEKEEYHFEWFSYETNEGQQQDNDNI